jgi:molybdopterin-containing oxidoreductase family membrane subunit
LLWWLTALVFAGLVVFGIFGYLQQRLHGDIVTGMRSIGRGGAAWGMYIMLDITFVGLAFAGVSIMCLARIFGLRELRPFSRIAGLMSACALSMAGLCVVADLGRPLVGLMNLPKYARTISPFFGTFTMVVGAGLIAIVVLMFLAARADAALCAELLPRGKPLYRLVATGYLGTPFERNRHRIVSRLLSLLILPLMVLSYSTLGFVFGIQSGRPGWFSAMQAPSFMVLAAISGTGLLILIAGLAGRFLDLREELPERAYRWLTTALLVLLTILLYFTAVEELTDRYAAMSAQKSLSAEMTAGAYAPLFWLSTGLFVVSLLALIGMYVRRHFSLGLAMTVGLVVNVAALIKRFLIVVPSQTHGVLLPYETGTYQPTWVEYAVMFGLFALGGLIFLVVVRIFPLVPLKSIEPAHLLETKVTRPRRHFVRWVAFLVTLVGGSTLAVLGFLWSARWGTEDFLDPVVPYSPVLFIVGLALCLGSAVVFELFPRPLAPSAPPLEPSATAAQSGSQ